MTPARFLVAACGSVSLLAALALFLLAASAGEPTIGERLCARFGGVEWETSCVTLCECADGFVVRSDVPCIIPCKEQWPHGGVYYHSGTTLPGLVRCNDGSEREIDCDPTASPTAPAAGGDACAEEKARQHQTSWQDGYIQGRLYQRQECEKSR